MPAQSVLVVILKGAKMAKQKVADCVRLFLKAIAVVVGLAGLCFSGYMPIVMIIKTVRQISSGELYSWGIFFSIVGFGAVFLIGAYLVFVSYLTLFKFSADAIEHLCLLLAMLFFSYSLRLTNLHPDTSDTSFFSSMYGLAIALAPFFLVVIFYRVSKNICIKLTGVRPSNDDE